MTSQQFINRIAPIAQKLRREGSHIFPSIRIAQSALETGWKIPSWNNMVGFKVGSGKTNAYWRGHYVNKGTWEVYDGERVDVKANFRAYDTIDDSFRDQDLLFTIPRYQRVREAKLPQEQANMLYACGYATDPQYAQKIMTIINNYGLLKYDKEVGSELSQELEQMKQDIAELKEQLASEPAKQWQHAIIHEAEQAGSIDKGKHLADEVAQKWFVVELVGRLEKRIDLLEERLLKLER